MLEEAFLVIEHHNGCNQKSQDWWQDKAENLRKLYQKCSYCIIRKTLFKEGRESSPPTNFSSHSDTNLAAIQIDEDRSWNNYNLGNALTDWKAKILSSPAPTRLYTLAQDIKRGMPIHKQMVTEKVLKTCLFCGLKFKYACSTKRHMLTGSCNILLSESKTYSEDDITEVDLTETSSEDDMSSEDDITVINEECSSKDDITETFSIQYLGC